MLLLLLFNPWAGLGRDQSSVRRLVWLWYAASWATSQGQFSIAFPHFFLNVPTFHHQVPPRPPRRERSQRWKWELWARMLSGNFAEMTTSTPFRDLLHAANLRHGTDGFTYPSKESVLRIFSPLKIRRLRPGLNPRTWVLKASTLPLDHRSRISKYMKINIKKTRVISLWEKQIGIVLFTHCVDLLSHAWIASGIYECLQAQSFIFTNGQTTFSLRLLLDRWG